MRFEGVVAAGFCAAGRRQEVTAKIPGITSFPWCMSVVGTSVVAGSLRESVRVWAGLEQACCLFLRAKAYFLGGFVEDVGNRIMPSVAIPGAGADSCVITNAIEDLAAHGHCVCCKAARVNSASQSQTSLSSKMGFAQRIIRVCGHII